MLEILIQEGISKLYSTYNLCIAKKLMCSNLFGTPNKISVHTGILHTVKLSWVNSQFLIFYQVEDFFHDESKLTDFRKVKKKNFLFFAFSMIVIEKEILCIHVHYFT